MARIEKVGDELVLQLSLLEKLGALHSSPRVPVGSITELEFVDQLWGSHQLRGVRAPGTAIPYVVLLGTLRGFKFRDFVAMKGRKPGVIVSLNSGKFARWIFTLEQPENEIKSFSA